MAKYQYKGFDMLKEGDPRLYTLPICDILRSIIGDRDYCYISASMFPLELTDVTLAFFEYQKGVPHDMIEDFKKRYITMDTLCPIDKLLQLWGLDKFNQMIRELEEMADLE